MRQYLGRGLYTGTDDDQIRRALPPQEVPIEERQRFRQRVNQELRVSVEERMRVWLENARRAQETLRKIMPPTPPPTQETEPMPEMITLKEAGALAGVSPQSITNWAFAGHIPEPKPSTIKAADGREHKIMLVNKEKVLAYAQARGAGRKNYSTAKTPKMKPAARSKKLGATITPNEVAAAAAPEPPPAATSARPVNDRRMAKVLTPDDAEWLLLEQAATLIGLSKAAVQDYIHSGDLMMLPGSPVVLVRRIDAELLKKKLNQPGESGPLGPMVDRLAGMMSSMNDTMRAVQTELKNNSQELKALRELLPGFLNIREAEQNQA